MSPATSPSEQCNCLLQGQGQFQLLRQLLPMVAQLPSAADRCRALARIWAAAVAADLDTRRAVRTRQQTLPSAELKQLLSDVFIMEVVSGAGAGVSLHILPYISCTINLLSRDGK